MKQESALTSDFEILELSLILDVLGTPIVSPINDGRIRASLELSSYRFHCVIGHRWTISRRSPRLDPSEYNFQVDELVHDAHHDKSALTGTIWYASRRIQSGRLEAFEVLIHLIPFRIRREHCLSAQNGIFDRSALKLRPPPSISSNGV